MSLVYVAPFHQTEHLARQTAHGDCLAIESAGERIERGHDVRDRAVAMLVRVRAGRRLGLLSDSGVGLFHHLLAKVDANKVVLKDVVVEHVFGSFA